MAARKTDINTICHVVDRLRLIPQQNFTSENIKRWSETTNSAVARKLRDTYLEWLESIT